MHTTSRWSQRLLAGAVALAGVAILAATLASTPSGAATPNEAAATSAATAASTAGSTKVVTVRPVDAAGRPAAGYTVKRERLGAGITCWGASPSAVESGIAICGPSAAYLPACWKSRNHTVLCLRDARSTQLVRVRYEGRFRTRGLQEVASPINLDLPKQQCGIRVGGAWSYPPSHPRWVGYYFCQRGGIYGPSDGNGGIDRSSDTWTVRFWNESGPRVPQRRVETAYVVGTAA